MDIKCKENGCCFCICEYFTTFVRVVGVILAIVLWIIGLNTIPAGIYVIFIAVIVSILEGLFLFETCITGCCNNDGCCGKTWQIVLIVDNWKRSIIYGVLSIPCFFIPNGNMDYWALYLAGVLLIILGLLYLVRTYKIMRMIKDDDMSTRNRNTSGKTQDNPVGMEDGTRTNQEMSYKADDEMGKQGDAGFGSWEERYPQ